MTVFFESPGVTLYHGDCLDVLRELPDASVDAVVTDPPYGLEFMGKEWDSFKTGRAAKYAKGGDFTHTDFKNLGSLPSYTNRPAKRCGLCGKQAWSGSPCRCAEPQWVMDNSPLHSFQQWCELWAAECLRVLKPGGHLLAFGGTRTFHRLACAVEDAGFEVRDSIAWLYGSGFPKSLDVSKAIDKARNDRADILSVTSRLAALAEATGITRADVDAYMGTSDMGGWWLSRLPHRCAVPSIENWMRLREFIPGAKAPGLDNDVWRLNGRKGSPGEAWSQREITGERVVPVGHAFAGATYGGDSSGQRVDVTAPATDAAREWQGWGTALKPAFEPVVVARKPLQGTVAANVQAHGTGALNIDGCRIGTDDDLDRAVGGGGTFTRSYQVQHGYRPDGEPYQGRTEGRIATTGNPSGRWPANVVLAESQAAALDEQSGESKSPPVGSVARTKGGQTIGTFAHEGREPSPNGHGDSGGASRFFYTAKADAGERVRVDGVAHPTVKPLSLMRWLVRLVTPPGGVVLEPFAGSGTTVEACILEGFQCIAIEREADYLPLIVQRVNRQRDPIAYTRAAGEDLGLFELGEAVS